VEKAIINPILETALSPPSGALLAENEATKGDGKVAENECVSPDFDDPESWTCGWASALHDACEHTWKDLTASMGKKICDSDKSCDSCEQEKFCAGLLLSEDTSRCRMWWEDCLLLLQYG
jgi:hypothetical protein